MKRLRVDGGVAEGVAAEVAHGELRVERQSGAYEGKAACQHDAQAM